MDRGKQGMKRSSMVDGYGIPLGRVLAGASRNNSPLLAPTPDKLDDLGPLPDDIRVQERCRKALGAETLPMIRLHDLRHTHATLLLLLAREPVHVVIQRLGHASPVVTMTVYAHVPPGNQRETANTFARLIREARTA